MSHPSLVNGHAAHHALEQYRRDLETLARTLSVSLTYLRHAQNTSQLHGLSIDIPSDKPIAEALETVEAKLRR